MSSKSQNRANMCSKSFQIRISKTSLIRRIGNSSLLLMLIQISQFYCKLPTANELTGGSDWRILAST